MMRCYVVSVLVVGFSLAACGGASNGAFAPRLAQMSARPLNDVLYSFRGGSSGERPYAGLLAGKNGEYYGTTAYGGTSGYGTVYEVTAAGKVEVIYSFQGIPDGRQPQSALIMDKDGALYGTTVLGGSDGYYCGGDGGCGTVFKLTPGKQGWTESVLYAFQGGLSDGFLPYGGVVMTKSGALLGTTYMGGTQGHDNGIVYELTPSGSSYSETVVHTFGSCCDDGLNPTAGLVADSSGNLYGTTTDGGCCAGGTVFKLVPTGSAFRFAAICVFKGGKYGKVPSAGVLVGANGALYGLTSGTGAHAQGTVFKLTERGNKKYTHSVIYRFAGGSDGADPDDTPGLIADRNGNLYGTTFGGGGSTNCAGGCGTVFKLAPTGKGFTESVLYAFQGNPDGAQPYGGVVIDGKGDLLGPTEIGGRNNDGAIFSIASDLQERHR